MSLLPWHVELGADETALIAAAAKYAREELLPRDRRGDQDGSRITEVLDEMGDMGLLSLVLPESVGGLGCNYVTYAAILHEVSSCSPSACVTIAVHNMVGSILERFAPESVRDECLPGWGTKEHFGAFALSEAGAGSDAGGVSARGRAVDGGFRVDGEKMWITNGISARWFLTLVRLEDGNGADNLCALLVDGNGSGIERADIHGKMGIRSSETAVINFTDVFVPESYLIGRRGEGLSVFLSTLNRGRVGIAAQATGIAEACLTEMTSYAKQREQFGRPIARFQAVGNMIADSAVDLQASRLLVCRASAACDADTADRYVCSMAKVFATEAANRIANRAVQVHGGAGYVNECRVEQLFRDARVTTIYEGTSEIQRLVIADGLEKQG